MAHYPVSASGIEGAQVTSRYDSIAKITKGDASGARNYWVVTVDANKLVTPSGKRLPYSTSIGTIQMSGEIRLWYPAASHPRDYQKGAMPLLLAAWQKLKNAGLIQPSSIATRNYNKHMLEYGSYVKV